MSSEIVRIDHAMTKELAREMAALEKNLLEIRENESAQRYPDVEAYTSEYFNTFWGMELRQRMEVLGGSKRILDIGVGRGESAVYLASLGHEVSCVEPSLACCQVIQSHAHRFGLSITLYNCPAEYMRAIPDGDFDVCIFNNSLHHCDDPLQSLRQCHALLRPGGSVFLMNEIFLRRYKSKRGFHRFVKEHPIKSGDYGGNEHAYYYHEYRTMLLNAGFRVREHIPYRYGVPAQVSRTMKTVLRRRFNAMEICARNAYFGFLAGVLGNPFLKRMVLPPLKHLSCVQITFEGIK